MVSINRQQLSKQVPSKAVPSVSRLLAGLLLLALATAPEYAQGQEAERQEAEEQEEETGFLERRIGDNWVLSPIIAPISSPETGFALAIGGLVTFSIQPDNKELPRSTISLFAVPATNGSIGFNVYLS